MFDILIKGASVIDGTGTKAKVEDVGIQGDTISEVGQIGNADARETFDAGGVFCARVLLIFTHILILI